MTNTDALVEFDIVAFARHYEALSDTFIDIRKAAESLKRHIPRSSRIFEIGLGTGYFARQFLNDGYQVCGIQPPDRLLDRLKQECPEIAILAEETLENYEFNNLHSAIVSHSSIFLFTRLETPAGQHGETSVSLVFQSFSNKAETLAGLRKVLSALSLGGRLFINIQTNPLPFAEVGPLDDRFTFEMLRCAYFFDSDRVEKVFHATSQGKTYCINENYYCLKYSDFLQLIHSIGGVAQVTDDRQWIIVECLPSAK